VLRSSPRHRRAASVRATIARSVAPLPARASDASGALARGRGLLHADTLRRAGRNWTSAGLAGALIGALGILLAMVTDLTAPPQTQAASQPGSSEARPPLAAFDSDAGARPVARLETPSQTKVVALRRTHALTTRQQAVAEATVSAILDRRRAALQASAQATEEKQVAIWEERQRERIRRQVAKDLQQRIAEAEAAVAAAEAEAAARRASGAEPPATDRSTPTSRSVSRTAISTSTFSSGAARLPLDTGVVGAPFGAYGSWSRYHTGVDFSAGYGAPVYAATAGVVTFAGNKGDWAGNHVAIRHGTGVSSMSSHLSSISVYPGQSVSAGQLIGRVGSTGRSFGPHLHYEVYPAGVTPGDVYSAVDPLPWLNGLGVSTY
jgi:murein DD-endopeptidase MepM/ murein hydrolase activator NlpD